MTNIYAEAMASYRAMKAFINETAPRRPAGAPRASWLSENRPAIKTRWLVLDAVGKRLELILNVDTSPRMYVTQAGAARRIVRQISLTDEADIAWLGSLVEVFEPMNAEKVREIKVSLGAAWGLSRPLHNSELARALRLGGRDPGATVQDWLTGKTKMTGPASVALEMMVAGGLPPDPISYILR